MLYVLQVLSGETTLSQIELVDVTARDGLQNEAVMLTTDDKISLINKIIEAGAKRIEVASFAHPKYVPQMADAEDVIAGLSDHDGIEYVGLVMNERGLDRALETKIGEVGIVCVATDTFARKNQNQTRDESVTLAKKMIERALSEGVNANVTIAASFGCPFEGEVSPDTVISMARELAEAAPREISIADTIGVGDPWRVKKLIAALRIALPEMPLRAHFHNTRNTGLANVFAAIESGATTIDVSVGGVGGCPFAPAATGNVPAEDVIYMIERGGYQTGISLNSLITVSEWLSKKLNKQLPSLVSRAGSFPNLERIVA